MKNNAFKDPIVSVVITTYNRAHMVRRAIQSVLDQAFKDLELIVVDDCSSDNTKEVVEAFSDHRLRYIHHGQNRGLSAARNTGINASRGKYVAFLDDDDYWKKDKLQKQIQLAETTSQDCAVIYCGLSFVKEDGTMYQQGNMPKLKGNIRSEIVSKGLSTIPSTCLFKKIALEQVEGYDENLESSVDHDIWMKMAQMDFACDYVAEALVITHIDDRAQMTADVEPRLRAVDYYLRKWQPQIERWFGEKEGKQYRLEYYARVIGILGTGSFRRGEFRKGMKCFYKIICYYPKRTRTYSLLARTLYIELVKKLHLHYLLTNVRRIR